MSKSAPYLVTAVEDSQHANATHLNNVSGGDALDFYPPVHFVYLVFKGISS